LGPGVELPVPETEGEFQIKSSLGKKHLEKDIQMEIKLFAEVNDLILQ
jgi:hypothetical protein